MRSTEPEPEQCTRGSPDSDDRDGSNQVSVSRASHKSQHRSSVLTRSAGGNDMIRKIWMDPLREREKQKI